MPKKLLKNYLSASDRLSEIMFGLIMAMTIIGASRIALISGDEEINGRVIIAATLGCNIAWGLVDGLMYIFSCLIDRGKYNGLIASVKKEKEEKSALALIDKALDSAIIDDLDEAERKQLCATLYKKLVMKEPGKVRIAMDDVAGAFVCFLLTFFTAFLIVVPFFIPVIALGIKMLLSRLVTLAMLFGIGYAYASHTGKGKVKTAIVMVVLGLVITAVIMVLGG
ncbi:MAG: VIT1/CCC1 transporter family protein [Candidatus Sigynarchaeota archaeon]